MGIRKPKFHVNQVVAMRTEAFQPYKIDKVYPEGMLLHKEPYYLFVGYGKNGSAESNLRRLSSLERG